MSVHVEMTQHRDPISGVTVRQLTDHNAHSHHLYFTNPGWFAGGRKLLIASDRGNRANLYAVETAGGALEQLTDLEPVSHPRKLTLLWTSVNPVRDEAYFWYGRELRALDLTTKQQRVLYEAAGGFMTTMTNVTADGRHVCAGLFEDLSDRIRLDLEHGYVGFAQMSEARPLSRVIQVAVDGSDCRILHEERSWIGHINTSPTQPHLLSFCHEGPWDKVDHRIWGLDMRDGRTWKIRPCESGEYIGHEYWFADGRRIGYHGRTPAGPVYGCVDCDNIDRVEAPFPHNSMHFHSNDLSLIVGDGTMNRRQILLWRYRDGTFEGPRVLCEHRGSWHVQQLHVHPRLSTDGRQVVFTADPRGYGQVFLADVPAFEELPEAR
jgi:oligogalacturonide lyase